MGRTESKLTQEQFDKALGKHRQKGNRTTESICGEGERERAHREDLLLGGVAGDEAHGPELGEVPRRRLHRLPRRRLVVYAVRLVGERTAASAADRYIFYLGGS